MAFHKCLEMSPFDAHTAETNHFYLMLTQLKETITLSHTKHHDSRIGTDPGLCGCPKLYLLVIVWGPGLVVGSICLAIWGTNPGSRNQEARAGLSGRGGDLECQSFIANSHARVDSEVSICLGQTCLCSIELWLLLL